MNFKTHKKIKNIAIAGAGGIGSHLAGMFFDFGFNRRQFDFSNYSTDIYDDDVVDDGNLLHQNFGDDDLHTLKVESLANRFVLTPQPKFMTVDDFGKYDLIFSCVDSMVFRKSLYEWSWENPTKAFWIDGRCESNQGAVFNKSNSKETLKAMLNDNQERTGCLLKYEKEQNISHTLPIVVAAMMLETFLAYVRGAPLPADKRFII
jgi:molybdopterin/thiamine biosynthesis adenylyltransferase